MRAILFALGLLMTCGGSILLAIVGEQTPQANVSSFEESTGDAVVPCPSCQETGEEKKTELTMKICRIYHVMTMGTGMCAWYMLPHNDSATPPCGSPSMEISSCNSTFGGCNGQAPHCTLLNTVVKKDFAVEDELAKTGADKLIELPHISKGPVTDTNDLIVTFPNPREGAGPSIIRARVCWGRTEPYRDKNKNKHPPVKFYLGRQFRKQSAGSDVDIPESEKDTRIKYDENQPFVVLVDVDNVGEDKLDEWYTVILDKDPSNTEEN